MSKRKRADIRKYESVLHEKDISATQRGDGIINDTFHTFDDLKHLPKGLSLETAGHM